MKVKYVGKIYNLFIVSIITTMLVSIIITVLSSITISSESKTLLSTITASNNENYYSSAIDSGVVSAPNYATVSNLDNQNAALVGANYVSSNIAKFSLADYIPLNTQIKNQGATSTCWTFSDASALQTYLALNDYLNDRPAYNYDFSERHISLASIETSSNNSGYNREPIDGATYWMAMNYFTRAAGPVLENECPFSTDNTTIPNNSNTYNLNKAATVTDIKLFPSPESAGYNAQTQINNMKTFIRTKGALSSAMYFPNDFPNSTFNTNTGASYVNSNSLYSVNHMISIIGWDDNYSKDNFNSSNKPSSNGAWLIRNSHGNHPYTDNGFLHISYEDKLIYDSVFGIDKADLAKDYSKVVGYNEKGMNHTLGILSNSYTLYNVYERNKNSSINELIDSISLYLMEDATVSIAIAEGDFNTNKNLSFTTQTIKNSTSVAPGFRTFNLSTPYKFNTTSSNASGLNNKVTVKVTVTATSTSASQMIIPLEGGYSKSYITDETYLRVRGLTGTTKTETGKCFIQLGTNSYADLGNVHSAVNDSLLDSDSTIQLNLVEGTKPTGALAVKTNPSKTQYNPGENFNSTGLTVKYNAGHGSTLNINLADCTFKKDKSLTNGQTSVELYGYGTKLNVPITVGSTAEITPTLTIKKNPTKTSYFVGDNFDSTGLVLNYKHGSASNPSTDEIPASAITITNAANLKENQTYVTAKYNNLTIQIPITVAKRTTTPPNEGGTSQFDDKDNLKNTTVELKEVRFNSKNASGFDRIELSVNNLVENSAATYKYSISVSNNTNNSQLVQEIETIPGTQMLNIVINSSELDPSFKLKTEDDVIYLTIKQLNKVTGNFVTRTIQVVGNKDTKFYMDGVLKTAASDAGSENNNSGDKNQNQQSNNQQTNNGQSNSQNSASEDKKTSTPETSSTGTTTPKSTSGDTTIANKKIPQTGTAEEIFKIVIISIVLVAGAFIVKTYVINRKISGK